MKISQSLLFAYAAAQDRWSSTDYYSFNYGFGNDGRQDSGVAFGLSENPTQAALDTSSNTYAALAELYSSNTESGHYKDQLHFNGLLCWMCDFRLDLATEAEKTICDTSGDCQNAYGRCLRHGMLMRCRGEQRTCMFEERRRHGVVYSVCTGCKQTDACVAHWRRNQRFTLPFMNFGDMSLRNLPQTTNNLLDTTTNTNHSMDQLPNHRPIYVDDECSTYQETRSEAAWRATQYVSGSIPANDVGLNGEVYPMGWIPTGQTRESTPNTVGNTLSHGYPFSSGTFTTNGSAQALQFTGHRVNLGLSYSRFAYDGSNNLQLNAQLSQWESTCRWCCHARPDTVCNIEMKEINSSPFATKCGNPVGTKRNENTEILGVGDPTAALVGAIEKYAKHPLYDITNKFEQAIVGGVVGADGVVSAGGVGAAYASNERAYWGLLESTTAAVNGVDLSEKAKVTGTPDVLEDNRCSLSNAQWTPHIPDPVGTSVVTTSNEAQYFSNNVARIPQGIQNKFRFFQPFNIAQSNADYHNEDLKTCGSASNLGAICVTAATCTAIGGSTPTCDAGIYQQGPRFWMQMFQRTPQYDMSQFTDNGQSNYYAKFPSTGEGRNSAGMDKFAGRGNKSRWTSESGNPLTEKLLRDNSELQHFYQQQTDMVSQENRDFFDSRARDAGTSFASSNMYLKRWDNPLHWTQK